MASGKNDSIRLDVRGKERSFWWVVQMTGPVRDLFKSSAHFTTRADALADFQGVCKMIGWENEITEVPVK